MTKSFFCSRSGDERLLAQSKQPIIHPKAPRLINRFKLGCDPEFALGTNGTLVEATHIGLRTDAAFGCDGSGRPVELRAYPSRFAVEVVASLLNSMRFLLMFSPEAAKCPDWLTGGYALRQPLGGHMHFGRKRPKSYSREWQALDDLTCCLHNIGYLPGQTERIWNGDYGRLGDVRNQKHGFEYRVFPSWLHTPWFAHLILTLGKLTVREPAVWIECEKATKPGVLQHMEKLLKIYRYLDDDAALALNSIPRLASSGFTTPFNLRPEWGLDVRCSTAQTCGKIPEVIKPDTEAVLEVIESIKTGVPPKFREPLADFQKMSSLESETVAPEFAQQLMPIVHWDFAPHYWPRPLRRGLFSLKSAPVTLMQYMTGDSAGLGLSLQVATVLSRKEIRALRSMCDLHVTNWTQVGTYHAIGIDTEMADSESWVRRVVEHLPIVFASTVNRDWIKKWTHRFLDAGLFQFEEPKELTLPYPNP